MKKILIIIPLIIVLGCKEAPDRVVYSPSFKDDPFRKQLEEEDRLDHPEKYETMEDINRKLDSMNAEGMGLIVRGSDKNYDTIMDHIHYIYITDK